MNERFDGKMNQSDTTLWRIELDPALRTTIVGISVLGEVPDWDRLRDRMEAVTWEIPRLRQKVVQPSFGVGTPRWVTDSSFDLDYHLRRVVAPAPGDLTTVLDLAGPAAMGAFDKDRPLWEFTLVEGLESGRAAMIQKIHHSLTDGVGAVRLARILFDEHAIDPRRAPSVLPGAREHTGGLSLALDTMTEQAHDAIGRVARTATAMPGVVESVVRNPLGVARAVTGTARSVVKLVRPAKEPMSPVMRDRGMSRRLGALDFSLDELKDAGHAAGGTLNDAFLASLAGGMRRYHECYGQAPEQLRVTMPINLRSQDEAVGNNRFTPARFAIPVDIADPVERMQRLGGMARSYRKEPGLKFTDVVAGVLNTLPPQATAMVLGGMLKAIDFVATNVPGLDRPAHMAGATVEQMFAFAPPSGAAFSAALLSHVDRCTLGLVIDTTAVSDPELLTTCMADGFDEVLAVGRSATRPTAGKRRR